MSTNKFFFLAIMSGNLRGLAQVQFNTVSAQLQRNLTAASLANMQDAAARMLTKQGIEFDDVVIHNIVFLAETTDEEFFRVQESQQSAEETTVDGQDSVVEEADAAFETLSSDGHSPVLAEGPAAEEDVQAEQTAVEEVPATTEPFNNSGSDRDEDAGE